MCRCGASLCRHPRAQVDCIPADAHPAPLPSPHQLQAHPHQRTPAHGPAGGLVCSGLAGHSERSLPAGALLSGGRAATPCRASWACDVQPTACLQRPAPPGPEPAAPPRSQRPAPAPFNPLQVSKLIHATLHSATATPAACCAGGRNSACPPASGVFPASPLLTCLGPPPAASASPPPGKPALLSDALLAVHPNRAPVPFPCVLPPSPLSPNRPQSPPSLFLP